MVEAEAAVVGLEVVVGHMALALLPCMDAAAMAHLLTCLVAGMRLNKLSAGSYTDACIVTVEATGDADAATTHTELLLPQRYNPVCAVFSLALSRSTLPLFLLRNTSMVA